MVGQRTGKLWDKDRRATLLERKVQRLWDDTRQSPAFLNGTIEYVDVELLSKLADVLREDRALAIPDTPKYRKMYGFPDATADD
jgi:hypothetical protein